MCNSNVPISQQVAMSIQHTQTTIRIHKTCGVCGGEPCVRNTRYTVAGLVQWRQLGLSDLQIMHHHPDLSQPDLDAAWDYYHHNADEIDRAIKDDEGA